MPPAKDNPVRLEGSERFHGADAKRVGEARAEDILPLILILRPREGAPPLPDLEQWAKTPIRQRNSEWGRESDDDFAASQEDVDKVVAFATDNGLAIVSVNLPRRMVEVSGTVAQINQAFGVKLGTYQTPGETYHGHEGPVHLPRSVVEVVQAVFGLDSRRLAFRSGGSSVTMSRPARICQPSSRMASSMLRAAKSDSARPREGAPMAASCTFSLSALGLMPE